MEGGERDKGLDKIQKSTESDIRSMSTDTGDTREQGAQRKKMIKKVVKMEHGVSGCDRWMKNQQNME